MYIYKTSLCNTEMNSPLKLFYNIIARHNSSFTGFKKIREREREEQCRVGQRHGRAGQRQCKVGQGMAKAMQGRAVVWIIIS